MREILLAGWLICVGILKVRERWSREGEGRVGIGKGNGELAAVSFIESGARDLDNRSLRKTAILKYQSSKY